MFKKKSTRSRLLMALVLPMFIALFFVNAKAGDETASAVTQAPHWEEMFAKQAGKEHDTQSIMIKFQPQTPKSIKDEIVRMLGGSYKDNNGDGIDDRFNHIADGCWVKVTMDKKIGDDDAHYALSRLRGNNHISYAHFDFKIKLDATIPNDTRFRSLWAMNQENDCDIDAPEAWDITTGSESVVVGIIDTGIDYNHPDLKDNIWTNPHEDPNGIDDDFNGYIDDIHGINAILDINIPGNGNPMDYKGHGTHCAGTIGATGGNGKGVVGVNWKVKMIGMKIIDSGQVGNSSDATACINYAISLKVAGVNLRVLNNSYNFEEEFPLMKEAIDTANDYDILFVASAGNYFPGNSGKENDQDNDKFDTFPANYSSLNVLSVAATTTTDSLARYSHYGLKTVDLGAPGGNYPDDPPEKQILSTVLGSTYGVMSGTSMAAPHVAGAAALLLSYKNDLTVADLKHYLMDYGDVIPALAGKCVSGKRLNLYKSLYAIMNEPSTSITVISPNGGEQWTSGAPAPISWTSENWQEDTLIKFDLFKGPIDPSAEFIGIMAQGIQVGSGVQTFQWNGQMVIPKTLPTGSDYWICIQPMVNSNPSLEDCSDGQFSILAAVTPSITVITPNGGENWTAGSSSDIIWSSTGTIANVKIEYSTNNGSTWSTIVASTANSNSYPWTISSTASTTCRVRISDAANTAINDVSDAAFTISAASTVYYNSPANRLVLLDACWAPASGGGVWTPEVQVNDISGGSTVQVYYSTGTNRRGPFTLWTNSGGYNRSVNFANILQTIDNLDGGAFTYYGTSGVLEFITQDASHLIQAVARAYNGNGSRRFPALADVETNTAALGRQLIIPNISNNTSYRPSVVLFNPSDAGVTLNVKIIGSNGVQIGSTIARTLAGYEMNGIATEVRANTYGNANIIVTVTSGAGRVMAIGCTANNVTNDPAAHLAVQTGPGYANSPEQKKILTEVNWSTNWTSEVQLTDISGGSVVQVYYNNGTNRRGPFTLWTNSGGANRSVTFANILQTIDGLDSGAFTYLGTSGVLELITQDASHMIQAVVRTFNGNYSRALPALGVCAANTAAIGRSLLIPNISNDTSFRPSVVLFNTTGASTTVEGKIMGANGSQIGSTFTRTLAGYEMSVITAEVRANTYSNANIVISVTSGSGTILVSGQTAHNVSNDPMGHIAVQAQ